MHVKIYIVFKHLLCYDVVSFRQRCSKYIIGSPRCSWNMDVPLMANNEGIYPTSPLGEVNIICTSRRQIFLFIIGNSRYFFYLWLDNPLLHSWMCHSWHILMLICFVQIRSRSPWIQNGFGTFKWYIQHFPLLSTLKLVWGTSFGD